ncbi:hypothetical protein D3C84_1196340 [compost metagenome]
MDDAEGVESRAQAQAAVGFHVHIQRAVQVNVGRLQVAVAALVTGGDDGDPQRGTGLLAEGAAQLR